MALKNIETFDKFVGYILADLYQSFPVCKEVQVSYFAKKCDMGGEDLILSETLFWLQDTGFLTFTGPKEKHIRRMEEVTTFPIFSCIVLTAKGLETLKKTPKSIDKKKGIGENIIDAVQRGAKAELSELVSDMLSMTYKIATY